jgi:DNA-binding NarL/FixJ family response regulator
VGSRKDLLVKVHSYSPDVAIVDIRLPPTHNDEGLQAALEIRKRRPAMGVLVLSQYVEVGLAMTLLAESAEGVGYLLKDRIDDVKVAPSSAVSNPRPYRASNASRARARSPRRPRLGARTSGR